MDGVFFSLILMVIYLHVWLLFCCVVTAVAAVIQWISKKQLVLRTIIISAYATLCVMVLMLMYLIYMIIYTLMWLGIWLALCLTVTMFTVIIRLINKKFRKKEPIHWAKKIAEYVAFYVISLFVIMKLFESYPGNWLGTDVEYRELAYELYNLNLDCYEYEKIYEGSHGEIVFDFVKNSYFSDHILGRTIEQGDYISIKAVVEEYMEGNENFQGKRIDIFFSYSYGEPINHIYNFDPRTGEMGTDTPYWFVTYVQVNNFAELVEFYDDFAGIRGAVYSMEGIQDLENLCNLTYFQIYMGGEAEKDIDSAEQYLEELNTLLPDCEIYLNQYFDVYPDWENFSD